MRERLGGVCSEVDLWMEQTVTAVCEMGSGGGERAEVAEVGGVGEVGVQVYLSVERGGVGESGWEGRRQLRRVQRV